MNIISNQIAKTLGLFFLCFFAYQNTILAQCLAGEAEVEIIVETDNWGYETYWELVPSGNNCGLGTIFSGGNSNQVGCNGGGQQNATSGGYANNSIVTEGPWCLILGATYDIILVDDYGDGGAELTVLVNGFEVASIIGSGNNLTESFTVEEPPIVDLSAHHNLVFDYTIKGDVNIRAEFKNEGQNPITSFDFNYSINNGVTKTQNITGVNIPFGEEVEHTHSDIWNVQQVGTFDVNVWISNINNNGADENSSNDSFEKPIVISESIPNVIDAYITEPYDIEVVADNSDGIDYPRDLDFHPDLSRKELWIVNKSTENDGGTTVTINNAGTSSQTSELKQDGNAWHFMSLPTAIAFGENGNWATSPGVQDANHGGGSFTGPSLWSSDPAIYAVVGSPPTAEFNGSHLDMLHGSPFSMGIAHLIDNTYFVFDAWNNEIVKYVFNGDHGPGKDDHSNGEVYRYSEVFVERDGEDVPNHLVIDKSTNWMYIADHKNSRIIRMDVNSGNIKNNLALVNEQLAVHAEMENVTFSNYITSDLAKPCGVEAMFDRLIVSDYDNGNILIFNVSGITPELLTTINTGLNGVMGVKIGPDGRIWFVDANSNTVNKINVEAPINTSISENWLQDLIKIYPNPASDFISIELSGIDNYNQGNLTIMDVNGSVVGKYSSLYNNVVHLDLTNLSAGNYFMQIEVGDAKAIKKFIKR